MRGRSLSSSFALVSWLTLAGNPCTAQAMTAIELDAAWERISAMQREQKALLEKVRTDFAALLALAAHDHRSDWRCLPWLRTVLCRVV